MKDATILTQLAARLMIHPYSSKRCATSAALLATLEISFLALFVENLSILTVFNWGMMPMSRQSLLRCNHTGSVLTASIVRSAPLRLRKPSYFTVTFVIKLFTHSA
jgi:hypothetical protein